MAGQVTVLKFCTLISPLYFALDSSSFVVIDSCVGTFSFFLSWRDTGKTRFWTPRLSGYGLLDW